VKKDFFGEGHGRDGLGSASLFLERFRQEGNGFSLHYKLYMRCPQNKKSIQTIAVFVLRICDDVATLKINLVSNDVYLWLPIAHNRLVFL
jgi:hypothetical protein